MENIAMNQRINVSDNPIESELFTRFSSIWISTSPVFICRSVRMCSIVSLRIWNWIIKLPAYKNWIMNKLLKIHSQFIDKISKKLNAPEMVHFLYLPGVFSLYEKRTT